MTTQLGMAFSLILIILVKMEVNNFLTLRFEPLVGELGLGLGLSLLCLFHVFFYFLFDKMSIMRTIPDFVSDNFSNDTFHSVIEYCIPDKFGSKFCGLRVLQVNLRSIRLLNRFDLFQYYISKFPHAFDILVLSETWIAPDSRI